MSVFKSAPEFIEQDSRQRRTYNPISLLSLTMKCETLLPKALVNGRSILDLGSCLGAMGHWALSHGGAFYHAIEVQDKFVTQSKVLLERWGDRVLIEQDDIRSALNRIPEKTFDIVVASGVLQTFMDPQTILELMCKVATQYLAIEATAPPVVRKGQVAPDLPILEFTTAACNSDAEDGQFFGPTAILSLAATEWICEQHGFAREIVDLRPAISKDNIAYSMKQGQDVMPMRYFSRFHFVENTKTENLEKIIKIKNRYFYQDWEEAPLNIRAKQQCFENKSAWEFDEEVARNFVNIAKKHIPQYSKTINACIDVIEKHKPSNAKIIDVGCATGETLRRLKTRGFTDLWGVDNSRAMLNELNVPGVNCIYSEHFPEHEAPFDVIIANWTLHFIAGREDYIKSIASSLPDNGLFFISEKITMSDLMKEYYYDFKRANKVTEEEIRQKEQRLQGILCTYPLAWYYNVLYKYGFSTIDVLIAERGFVTLCCQHGGSGKKITSIIC